MNRMVSVYDKYFEWVRMGIKSQLAYRGIITDRLLGFSVHFIVLYFFWNAVYSGRDVIGGRTLSDMVIYIALSVTITSLYVYPSIFFMSSDIKSGNIIYLLLKPIDYQLQFFSKHLGIFIFMLSIVGTIFVVFSTVLIQIPVPENFVYFVLSLLLGFLTVVSFDFFLGTLCFWTENNWGISYFQRVLTELLSGTLIPLDFFPKSLQLLVIKYLPFQGIVYTPIRLFQQRWSFGQFMEYVSIQLLWITFFIIVARVIFSKARKIVMINGG